MQKVSKNCQSKFFKGTKWKIHLLKHEAFITKSTIFILDQAEPSKDKLPHLRLSVVIQPYSLGHKRLEVLTVRPMFKLVKNHPYDVTSNDLLTVDKDTPPSGIRYKFVCAYICLKRK